MSSVMPVNVFVAQCKDKGRTVKDGRRERWQMWIDKGKCDNGLKKLGRKKFSAFNLGTSPSRSTLPCMLAERVPRWALHPLENTPRIVAGMRWIT
jgi:hypothetical protein